MLKTVWSFLQSFNIGLLSDVVISLLEIKHPPRKKEKKKTQLLKQALEKPRDYVFIVALFKTAKGGNNPIFKGQKKG